MHFFSLRGQCFIAVHRTKSSPSPSLRQRGAGPSPSNVFLSLSVQSLNELLPEHPVALRPCRHTLSLVRRSSPQQLHRGAAQGVRQKHSGQPEGTFFLCSSLSRFAAALRITTSGLSRFAIASLPRLRRGNCA